MRPFILYTRGRIFRNYTGFSFFFFIWISRLEKQKERLIRHETIHFIQQVELLFIFHWLLYALFYVVSRAFGQRHYIAYRYNPFEVEAYDNDVDMNYLASRKPYAWLKSIRKFREVLRKDMSGKIPEDKNVTW